MKFIDLTGKKFGKLKVLNISHKANGRIYWKCRCDCGVEKNVLGQHLKSGRIVSCGCSSIERISVLNKTHGKSNTRLYNIWSGIKSRCENKNDFSFKRYGGKGIRICDEWKNNFQAFYDWSYANGYQNNLTIDRIDNNGNYEPSNCRWTTQKVQSNNTSRTIKLTYMGNVYSVKQLAEFLNLNYKKFIYGLHKFQYDIEKSIDYAKKYKQRR